jgi:hypothetical protein
MNLIFHIISLFFWPIIVIGLIVFFVRRKNKKRSVTDRNWYLSFAFSKEDAVSQLFFLLSLLFFGLMFFTFNKDLGDLFSWYTIIFITSAVGLIGSYYLKTIYTLFFSLIGLASWWSLQAIQWVEGDKIKGSVVFAGLAILGLLFYSIGLLHEKKIKFKRFAFIYLILGILTVVGSLFFFSTKFGIGLFGEITKGSLFFHSWQLTISLFVFFISIIGLTFYGTKQKIISLFEFLGILILTLFFGTIVFLSEQVTFISAENSHNLYFNGEDLSSSGILWALIYNFTVFFTLLGVILSGYLRREIWLINLGALFLFLLIIIKYFNWFFTSVDKSIFFISAGVLFFAIGWFMEKGRRLMLINIREQKYK